MADTDSGSDCSDESFADRIQRAQDDDSEDSDASEESDESEDSECSDDSTESAVVDDLHDYELYDATKPTLIIGIDLGTTYSGVAYAFASNPKEIFNVEDWPHAAGKAYEKCPTVLSYGSTNKIKWGFAVSDHDQGRIEAFKLLLDPEQRRPDYAPARDAQRAIRRLPKSVVDVVADYLRLLWNHSLKVIASKYPPGFLNHVQKRFFLTVPAVWSDRAKIKTLKAARRANIRPAKLVKEPEAAALWTTTGLAETWLSAGDAVVVCDAGGGTVDLITYELFGPRPLKLKELVQAQGGIFGSKLINDRFEKHLQGVIGEEQFTTFSRTQSFRAGMTAFNDLIKPAFCTGERRARTLNFPRARLKDNRDKGLERDTLKITWSSTKIRSRDTLNRFFYPVANDVAKLVTTQVNAARIIRQRKKCHNAFQIKAIFLVGGFGASEYLKQEIERQNPGILVIRPTNAWSAIARGATVSGLPQQTSVAANVAPKHYGVSGVEFDIDPIKDAGRPTTIDPHTGRRQIKKMTWYIYRGQELDRARPIAFDWFMNFPENPSDDVLEENPIRLWESVQRIAQRHPDRKMSTNCVLWPLLSKVPKEFFERKSRLDASGRLIKWWRLDFKILITVQSGPMKFTLNCRGRQYGSINANY